MKEDETEAGGDGWLARREVGHEDVGSRSECLVTTNALKPVIGITQQDEEEEEE